MNKCTLTESDFQKLESFALHWRFTDPKYNLLPKNVLETIRPFSVQKAQAIFQYINEVITPSITATKKDIKADHDNPSQTKKALAALFPSLEETEIILSYGNDEAIFTSLGTFCEYWDDFCYPGSDDIVIFPLNEQWTLAYNHHEVFQITYKAPYVV